MRGFRKNMGCWGELILRASEAELFKATPSIFPGVRTGGCQ